jgi:class 3 adenylate cyclase
MSSRVVASVKVLFPDGSSKIFDIRDGDSLRLGRTTGTDIQLDDPAVSRAHAVLSGSSSGVVVSDLSSTNGTYLNGAPISRPVDLQNSDIVDIGPFKISVLVSGAEMANATTVPGRTMTAQLRPTQTVVLVARLRAFRRIKESLSELEITALWELWRQLVARAVQSSGGLVDKVLDECIVAVWYGLDGLKTSSDAVRAAQQIDLVTRQHSVAGGWKHHDRFPLTCSLVLNSGLALMGGVSGKTGAREFAVLGDTVNVAFRVAELTEALSQSVFISEDLAKTLDKVVRTIQVDAVTHSRDGALVQVFAVQL